MDFKNKALYDYILKSSEDDDDIYLADYKLNPEEVIINNLFKKFKKDPSI